MPTVQAIIPAYNPVPAHLHEAVQSCLTQPEIVGVFVIDDGSAVPVQLPFADSRLHLVRQSNAGPSAARNRALEAVTADYALLLDHDDCLEPAAIIRALQLAESYQAAAVISARYEFRAGKRTLKEVPPAWRDRLLPNPGEVFRPLALFGASGLLIARAPLRAGVRFDPQLLIGEDRDFLRRVATHGPIAVSSHPLLTVRQHEGAQNLSSPAHLARRAQDHLLILERHHAPDTDAPLRDQTLWLINQLSKENRPDPRLWQALISAAKRYHWSVPLKPRIRARLRKIAHG